MTRDQVRTKFEEIIEPEAHKVVSEKLSELLDLSAQAGPRPDATTPKLVKKLWK